MAGARGGRNKRRRREAILSTNTTRVRTIGLAGPSGAGKTSLRHALAAAGPCGEIKPEASPELAFAAAEFMGDRYVFVDPPGALEFAAEMDAALPAMDLVIVVIDPDKEKAALAQPYLRQIEAIGVPHAIFVNKIDTAHGSLRELLEALQPMSSAPLVARQIPIWRDEKAAGYVDLALKRAYLFKPGKASERVDIPADMAEREHEARFHMLEQLADFDDGLLEQLLSDVTPSNDAVFGDLVKEMNDGLIVPVFLGSAQQGFGVRRLLKALRHETPAPARAAARLGLDGPCAYVLKVSYAGQAGKLAYARVLGGSLEEGVEITLTDGGARRLSGLQGLNGTGLKKTSAAHEGDIVALGKVDELHIGDCASLNGQSAPRLRLEARAPVYQVAVRPKDRKDDVRLGGALQKLIEEDHGLSVVHDPETHETYLRGLGEGHVRLRLESLRKRFNIEVEIARPITPYKESVRKKLAQRGRHKKQTGGHGQFGDVVIEMRPLDRGEGFVFDDKIAGGVVPKQWIPAVEQGVRDALEKGPLGFRVVDVGVTLTDGSYHSVDSSEQAFRTAGRIAMSEALKAGEPYLLEPIDKLTIYAPSSATARINGAITSRNGQILGFEGRDGWTDWDRIETYLPRAELQDFLHELKAHTQGMGVFEAQHSHLVELSGRRADDVLKAHGAQTGA
jgi:elongation factor G